MKRMLLPAIFMALLFIWSCQSDDLKDIKPIDENGMVLEDVMARGGNGKGNGYGLLRTCATHEVLQRKLKQNPALIRKMQEIEAHTLAFKKSKLDKVKKPKKPKKGKGGTGSGGSTPDSDSDGSTTPNIDNDSNNTDGDSGTGNDGIVITDPLPAEDPGTDYNSVDDTPDPLPTRYTIPVYVHVIHSNSAEFISIEQIRSQIEVLNADFSGSNTDINNTPAEFKDRIADAGITFTLDENLHIKWKSTTRAEWGTGDEMKSSAKGGSDAYRPEEYLNIWVCNIGGGVLGYAQIPGTGTTSTDGIVVAPLAFGTTGYVAAPYNKGRTATHEVGHWLNLRHIWGDGGCEADDFVADTPLADRPSYGCAGTPSYCKTPAMTMNFMDYSDDACMYMFTQGQKFRMHALFSKGGSRSSFAQ
ncbi:hypothetical protein D770_04020 [Flammeovirgaceae bacterium 311]|nr:hypothetical protein D770_04020 [Flammeovirgaceae bacterium 311]